jgi:hypothetical protein
MDAVTQFSLCPTVCALIDVIRHLETCLPA